MSDEDDKSEEVGETGMVIPEAPDQKNGSNPTDMTNESMCMGSRLENI